MEKYKYKDLTGKIIGCAMNVHSSLGSGYQESIYQRCLAREFQKNNISHIREKEMPIFYDGIMMGRRRVDMMVEGKVLVELKAVSELEKVHYAQAINYLEAFNMEIGLLLNFGTRSLQFKRLINSKRKNL
ncbi:GxxExxY protein [Patescibacteria group bacterium]|nr:GxxExxY protein [Patescibacteria group bacterium]MBU1673903.1 GxxExxY protein [Patescibacteria group bacterium]MBU1963424.1 GxxExxY protein [Patescibacteria group bacterium]